MKSKLLISIYIILVGGLIYFAYPTIKSRYFNQGEIKKDLSGKTPRNEAGEEIISQEETINLTEEDNNDDNEITTPEEEIFLEITNKNCENKCADFASDTEKLKYCQQSCGLASINKKADGCETKTGLERDYCFKDLAINKKDFAACEKIQDTGIKKTCKNRVTEDILNGLDGKAD